jgi:hypothetical protein
LQLKVRALIVVEVLHVLAFTFAIEGKALIVVEALHVLTFTFAIENFNGSSTPPKCLELHIEKIWDEVNKCFPFPHKCGNFAPNGHFCY